MEYIFMHQNIPVAELEMDESAGLIQKVNRVFAPEHLPTGVSVKKDGRLYRKKIKKHNVMSYRKCPCQKMRIFFVVCFKIH